MIRCSKARTIQDCPVLNNISCWKNAKKPVEFASDNRDLPRSCHITIEIEPNLKSNIDRAVELINRTNQLNSPKFGFRKILSVQKQTSDITSPIISLQQETS